LEHRGSTPLVKGKRRRRGAPVGLAFAAAARLDERLIMRELLRTNDPVTLSWIEALLREAGIGCVVLDAHTSILEGSIGAIPRRLMVPEADWQRARDLLAEAAPSELP
jgi:hypothetical protein